MTKCKCKTQELDIIYSKSFYIIFNRFVMNLIVIFATFKMCSSIFTLWNKMRNQCCLIRMDVRRNQPVKFVGSRRPVLYSSAFWPMPNPERDYCICLGGAGPPRSPPSASPVPHGIPDGWLSEMTEWSSVAAWNKQAVYICDFIHSTG